MATKKETTVAKMIDIEAKVKHMIVKIEGDGDLIINKMNARNERMLTAEDRKTVREKPNFWEDVITAVHWRDPLPMEDTYTESTEEMMHKQLSENAPCITAFGLKKSFGDAVVRNEIDKYKTKLDNAINVVAINGLVPVKFASWNCEKKLMSPKRGAPINVVLNHFQNWSAEFKVDYLDHVYSRDQILNIINLAGFGIGIGSGRTSGYGRYHIVEVKE
jgi:hypothetical protein